MVFNRIIKIFLILMFISPTTFAIERKYNVGYMVLDLRYDQNGLQKKLTVAVWYPTNASPKPFQYGGPAWGNVALNANPAGDSGKFPFLAFSHGYGGTGLGAQFFTEEIASRGWIVACPDHNDDAKKITHTAPDERNKYLYRPQELETVIRVLTTSSPFSSLIDTNRMAAGGHSFGGFTSMALCGAIPEFHDKRIRAILMFSTGAAAYLFTDEELASVEIPSMLYLGKRERNQKRGEATMKELSGRIYKNMSDPKYFLEVRGANHFSFNIRLSGGAGTKMLSGTPRQFEVINKYSIAFLEKYVAGRPGQDEILDNKDRMITKQIISK